MKYVHQNTAKRSSASSATAVLLVMIALAALLIDPLPAFLLTLDTMLYGLAGHAIYAEGLLPYDVVFEHKPFLTYFLYGPLAFIDTRLNIFTLYAAVWIAISVFVARQVLLGKSASFASVALCLILAAQLGRVLNGNTELPVTVFAFLAIGWALRAETSSWRLPASAAAAVAAVNVNYVAAFILAPPILYCLFATARDFRHFLIKAAAYLSMAVGIVVAVFAMLALAGMDVVQYFEWQIKFLTTYSGQNQTPSGGFTLLVGASLLVAALAALPMAPVKPELRRPATALAIFVVFANLSFFISTKFHEHYIYLALAPAALILTTLDFSGATMRRVARLASVAALVILLLPGRLTWQMIVPATDYRATYAPLAEAVDGSAVMPMRSSVMALFFAKLRPLQPFVWFDHAELVMGDEEDSYFTGLLEDRPTFVMTLDGWCAGGGAGWAACAALDRDYRLALTMESRPGVEGYDLYALGAN